MTDSINFLGRCSICGKKYKKNKVRVVERYEHLSFVYGNCAFCKSSTMFAVTVGELGMVTTVGVLTDLQGADLKKFLNSLPISADDVLEAHQYFQKAYGHHIPKSH